MREYAKQTRERQGEAGRLKRRNKYAANPDLHRAQKKAQYARDPQKYRDAKKARSADPAERAAICAARKKHYEANRSRILEYKKACKQKLKDAQKTRTARKRPAAVQMPPAAVS